MKSIAQIPTFGTMRERFREMRYDRIAAMKRFMREGGDVARLPMLGFDVVIANTPEMVHDVLVARARSFEKSPVMRAALFPLAGDGLFTSEGELWRRQRKVMAPLFQPASIAHFGAAMTGAAERAAREWKDGAVVDIARETTRIAMSIAGQTLFDEDMWGESDELGAALTTALDWAGEAAGSLELVLQSRTKYALEKTAKRVPPSVAAPLLKIAKHIEYPFLWPGQRSRELRAALDVLDRRVARMIAERREDSERTRSRRDLLTLLLSARDEDGSGMTDRQVRDEVLTLFVAGHETTANALAWSLMLLARHPEVYAKVRAEVDALGRIPTSADLPSLALCLRVFKESMRLYPPVYMFGRVAVADVEVGDYRLPRGTIVLVCPWALHRRPDEYPDPERFDPDRFLPEVEAKRAKTAFLPFSAGPRTCIGNYFALMEGPLVLATLLRHADVALATDAPIEPEPSATLRPKGGVPMRIALRRA
ncbi:MAG: cytochrome P450 [Deltaproteobacteria bacterium]|nr:cytochrome P450 [Deltaproteobacteria bacterium]